MVKSISKKESLKSGTKGRKGDTSAERNFASQDSKSPTKDLKRVASAESQNKRRAFKRVSKEIAKTANLSEWFENFDRIKKEQTKKLLLAYLNGDDFKIPAMGIDPIMRYVPSRLMMQRMIRRAVMLPDHFTDFEYYNSLQL